MDSTDLPGHKYQAGLSLLKNFSTSEDDLKSSSFLSRVMRFMISIPHEKLSPSNQSFGGQQQDFLFLSSIYILTS
jgi:hypothetical protein